ncbi:MAG: alpha/beta hydrolase [Microbacteriaceae bacterium]|nr:alpha/beta hydrolase [Microbacteriaceae bacterium]
MTYRPEFRAMIAAHVDTVNWLEKDPDRRQAIVLAQRTAMAPPPHPAPIPVAQTWVEELGHSDLVARVYRPDVEGVLPVLLYFHGGGWIGGTLDVLDDSCRIIANSAECVVVNADYRLAPEHPYPVPLEDCMDWIEWVDRQIGRFGGDPNNVAVAGNSAGGHLATAAVLRARAAGRADFAAQVLVYPVLAASVAAGSYRTNERGPFLSGPQMAFFWESYLGRPVEPADLANPDLSPGTASDLAGVPPTILVSAENDPLSDECDAYAAALRKAGVPIAARRYEGQIHGFFTMSRVTGDAHHATIEAARRLRDAFDATGRKELQQLWDASAWR